MAYTLESVLKELGDDAQLVGGRVIIYRDGKHTDVGGLGLHDGAFNLTEEGVALLDGEEVVEAQPTKETKASKGKADKDAGAGDKDVPVGDKLDLVD